jgi:hypothetical protein
MSDVAKSKRASKPNMEEHEHLAMVDSLMCRRGEPTAYVAPGADLKWRVRNLLDIHWEITAIKTPSPSHNRVMSCVIDHANPTTGRCDPGQTVLADKTGYSKDTVARAIKWAEANKLLRVEKRGLGRSNAYHPQWDLLEMLWVAVQDNIEEARAASTCGTSSRIKGRIQEAAPRCLTEPQSRTSKDEPHPERARSDEHAPKEQKEGIQGKQVEGAQTSPQALTGGPSLLSAMNELLARASQFDRENCTEADLETAAAAELSAPGSGFSVLRQAATAAWKAKRKGAQNG